MPVYEYFCQACEEKFDIKATIQEKEKGLKANCPVCGSSKTFQLLGNFFTFSKSSGTDLGSGCGLGPPPGCCR